MIKIALITTVALLSACAQAPLNKTPKTGLSPEKAKAIPYSYPLSGQFGQYGK